MIDERIKLPKESQIILDTIRNNNEKLDLKIDKIKEDITAMRICHIENKNKIDIVEIKLDNHLQNHSLISKPFISWIVGGGFLTTILSLFYFLINRIKEI